MTKPDTDASFDLYMVRSFFDAETCGDLLAEMRRAPSSPATVYGQGESGSVDERVRKAARLVPSRETVELVRRRLLEY